MTSSYLSVFYFASCLCCIYCNYCFNCDALQTIHTNKVYCVTSTSNTNHGCPAYDFVEQNTLTHYLSHSSKYFNSHETYFFQDGNHTLLVPFRVQIRKVTNLTLVGPEQTHLSKKAIIDCNGTATRFKFNGSSNIVIANLTFTSCVHQYPFNQSDQKGGLATLIFFDSANISLLGVTLLGSVFEAFFILDAIGNITIDNVLVENSNTAGHAVANIGSAIAFSYCHNNASAYLSITNSKFINNTNIVHKLRYVGAGGLIIIIKCPNVTVKIFNVTMSNNTGYNGGNLAVLTSPKYLYGSIEVANSTFEGGRAAKGAGMFLSLRAIELKNGECNLDKFHEHKLLYVYNTSFRNNVANYYGGGVYIEEKESYLKCNMMNLITFEWVNFTKNALNFNYNGTITGGGIALHSMSLTVTDYVYHVNPQFKVFLNQCSIHDNYIKSKYKVSSATGVVFLKSNHFFSITNTAIFHNKATGILGMSSNIILSQNVTISNNNGSSGGGMLLCQNAVMYLEAHTNVTIAHNRAVSIGGGIAVETNYLESQPVCFFQLQDSLLTNKSLIETISVSVHANSASFAGNNIFGGSIEHCYIIQIYTMWKHKGSLNKLIYDKVFHVPKNTVGFSSISSPPHKICLCQNKKLICKNKYYDIPLYKFPGETFSIDAVLVGQFDGTVPGTVEANLLSKHSSLKQGERVQKLSSTFCNQLNYTVYTNRYDEVLHIRVQHTGDVSGFEDPYNFKNFTTHIHLKDCPVGFTQTKSYDDKYLCDCNRLLKKYEKHVSCDITTQTVKRVPPVWIGNVETENGTKIVAVHKYCPFDYCLNTDVKLFSSNGSLSQNKQCAFNRTGVLCGSCSERLSVVLGSSKCHICSNYWMMLLIPIALTGVAFLIILILFDITIADGTLSGIIFYFNIIGSNITTFFPAQSGKYYIPFFFTQFIKDFISLINLTLGLSTCLFNGMDSYTKAWLDFAFPLYLWLLAGVFIFIAGGRCSWIVRHNAVKVLATFILLSYTRLLSSVAESLQVSVLKLETGGFELRWLIDGNIKYFEGKHIPLAIFAMMLGLLLLPFALSLFFIQWLQKVSDWKVFSWINRLKPFFDVYTGPFTASGRFWTGLLLLSRGLLLATTAVNVTGSPNTILGAILLVVVILLLAAGLLTKGLYRRRCLNVLEYSSLVNLGALSSLLLIFESSCYISNIFVSIEIFLFIGVIVYHFSKNRFVQNTCCYRKLNKLKLSKIPSINKVENRNENAEDREPLLATY